MLLVNERRIYEFWGRIGIEEDRPWCNDEVSELAGITRTSVPCTKREKSFSKKKAASLPGNLLCSKTWKEEEAYSSSKSRALEQKRRINLLKERRAECAFSLPL